MKFNRDIHHRRSIRLENYDYTQPSMYFVTLCAQHRKCIFGRIIAGEIHLSPIGHCALSEWDKLPDRFANIQLDAFVVMPNHVHLIIQFKSVGAPLAGALNVGAIDDRATARVAPTLGNVIGAYKSLVVHQALGIAKQNGEHLGELWQRNYWEHIVRNEEELKKIRDYILNNPLQWEQDRLYVAQGAERSGLEDEIKEDLAGVGYEC